MWCLKGSAGDQRRLVSRDHQRSCDARQSEVRPSAPGRLARTGGVREQLHGVHLLGDGHERPRELHERRRDTVGRAVKSASNAALGATILTNAQGITLYRLSGEQNGKFICTSSGCLQVWHPADGHRSGHPERQRRLAGHGQASRRDPAGDIPGHAAVHVRRRQPARRSEGAGPQGLRHVDSRDGHEHRRPNDIDEYSVEDDARLGRHAATPTDAHMASAARGAARATLGHSTALGRIVSRWPTLTLDTPTPSARRPTARRLTFVLVLIVAFMAVEVAAGVIATRLRCCPTPDTCSPTPPRSASRWWPCGSPRARPAGAMTFGFRRVEILSAQANGVTLLILAGFIAYEAIRRLFEPPMSAAAWCSPSPWPASS